MLQKKVGTVGSGRMAVGVVSGMLLTSVNCHLSILITMGKIDRQTAN